MTFGKLLLIMPIKKKKNDSKVIFVKFSALQVVVGKADQK